MTRFMLLRTALRSLRHHKGRSFMTMLGIIIGIASIIIIMAIGHGAQEKVRREIIAAGDNYIFIHTGNWLAEGKSKKSKHKVPTFTEQNITALKHYIPSLKKLSPVVFSKQQVTAGKLQISSEIKAGNQDMIAILDRHLKNGNLFNYEHVATGARVTILGHKAAQELFKKSNPIGQLIQIKKTNFTVIGVLKEIIRSSGVGNDPNTDIFIPLSTARRIGISYTGGIRFMALSITTLAQMPQAVQYIKKLLRAQRRIAPNDPDDFMIWDQASMLKAAHASSAILNILLFIIASISLLVGGIGVMNIMLVSVTERTQEIGIRMALGASSRVIRQQFLFEALTLCTLGGLIGIAFGVTAPYGISRVAGWTVIITPWSIIVSLISIVLVGLLFGFYPASKASRLNPVIALTEQ